MTIKQTGGIFGRNVSFTDVTTDEVTANKVNISTVGGMGLFSGSLLYAGAGDTTLLFSSGGDAILPRGSAGASRDTAVNLGNSTNRWKDIHSNGDVFIGTSNVLPGGNNVEGIALSAGTYGGHLSVSRSGDVSEFNRIGSDGRVIIIRQGGGFAGAIATRSSGGNVQMYTDGGSGIDFAGDGILPMASDTITDNSKDVGSASFRWDDIYATNGTIQTSDRNEKQDIEELSDAEQRVAVAAKGLLRKFRWKSSVAENGDNARTHFGIIAQDLQAAFAAEGLDAGDYAMFISTTWWEADRIIPAIDAVAEELDDDGNVIVPAVDAVSERTVIDSYNTEEEAPEGATQRTRLGVRYSELLAFIIAST